MGRVKELAHTKTECVVCGREFIPALSMHLHCCSKQCINEFEGVYEAIADMQQRSDMKAKPLDLAVVVSDDLLSRGLIERKNFTPVLDRITFILHDWEFQKYNLEDMEMETSYEEEEEE